jgi:Fe-S-cluster containining protein
MSKFRANGKLLNQLKRSRPADLDYHFRELHEEVFSKTDCLSCANCCKTTSPVFKDWDIERLAAHYRIRPAEFIQRHLKMDEEGDFVLTSSPCTFLNDDNTCRVYDDRPDACRGYPHTNRRRMHTMLDLTLKNAEICPAVAEILEVIKLRF